MQRKLLTKALAKKLPPIGSQDGKDAIAYVKFFNPTGAGTWYITEYDGADTFFGYVTGLGHDELGYISKSELESLRVGFGLKVERDQWFTPTRLSEIKNGAVS